MNEEELLSPLHGLVRPDTGKLDCRAAGHGAGHVCLTITGGAGLDELVDKLGSWYGEPRTLVSEGRADPAVRERTGLPLITPFGDGERVVEMRAWAFGGRWIGCGVVRVGGEARLVVVVAPRTTPASDELPADASWLDRIVAVTGWDADQVRMDPIRMDRMHTGRIRTADCAAAEARLGTALPSDYKRLVETFGDGSFDGYLDVYLPADLVKSAEWAADWAKAYGTRSWEPHPPFPEPGGLLPWASTEQELSFYWITEGPDPDTWPVYVRDVEPEAGDRFDMTATEFVFRMLADPEHPYSMPAAFAAHWFMNYNRPC
ncbi:SMI1/KNR4 family protein [Streptomyces sp. LZ34]